MDIAQENKELADAEAEAGAGTDGLKHLHYDFDLISGKVNKLSYQSGFFDQFYYRYEYDNQNRLIGAYTSRFNFEALSAWVQEATYSYYAHGPLARMELGNVSMILVPVEVVDTQKTSLIQNEEILYCAFIKSSPDDFTPAKRIGTRLLIMCCLVTKGTIGQ